MSGLIGGRETVIDNGSVAGFQVNEATYGNVVPLILGTSRQAGNVIDYFNFTAIRHAETQSAGKGGASTTTISYTYKAAILMALAEGQISGVGKIWEDTDTVTTLADSGVTLFDGAIGQAPWSYTQSVSPDRALPYSGLAYVAGYIDLNSNGGLKQYNFEIKGKLLATGDGVDVNPADAVGYILADFGAGENNANMATFENFRTFCKASDLYITLALTDQAKAYEITNRLCEMANTIVFWSQSKMKFVPRCETEITGNGVTYAPNTTPEYDLDEDDLLELEDGVLVTWERTDNAETYNQVTVEFTNRANNYETETVDYQILADINKRGLRPMSTVTYHEIHTKARAEYVAQMLALESCYGRNTFNFKLGLAHSLLEPGDIVTLTDAGSGLSLVPVQIESIEEDGDEEYKCTAKYRPFGTYSPARYATYDSVRAGMDRYADPGNVAAPVFFETPWQDGSHNVGIMACGVSESWGGAYVWISADNQSYQQIGQITSPSRYGHITGGMSSSSSSVTIQLEDSTAQLLSVSSTAADAGATLIAIGAEWMAYETATLVSAGIYALSGLRRGLYGTAITSHDPGDSFLRYDVRSFVYPYTTDMINRTYYVKLTSYNVWGNALQDLADVQAYSYAIQGAGALTRTERATVDATAGWASYSFSRVFNDTPTLTLYCQTPGGQVYWRNVSANGYDALIQVGGVPAAGEFIYEARGW
ncbi:phage tail protein [Anaeromusa sp.]|uniref:phage tail protein n=1 Tax=Anaeromusa sp. TaxID=1872520 RepID=UPI0026170715|nr:phage tail protein [Anaeromusa sp.]MDD3157658.1 phage tail protein [Anaeromusa sp.]